MFRRDFGETVAPGRPLPALADCYRGGLRLDAEPGTRYRYSDHGPATLGQIVQDLTGTPFDRYLREQVFLPLGMVDTDVVRTGSLHARIAIGYRLRSDGLDAVPERQWVTTGASGAYSTPRDMAGYLEALTGGGANEHGSVLKPGTLASMFDAHYRNDPRLPGVGLGFFRVDAGDHTVVEHQGILPGFDSQIVADPDDGVGVTKGTRRGMTWLPVETGRLLDRLIGIPDEAVRTDVPHHPEVWGDRCGWYELPGTVSDVRLRATMGAGAEVFVRGGELRMRFLTPVPALSKGVALHPDDPEDPYVFRMDFSGFGIDAAPRVVFSQDAGAGTTAVHLALMPVSMAKRPPMTNPRRWLTGALAATGTAIAVRRRHRAQAQQGSGQR